MARKKKTYSNEFKWIEMLKSEGYTYMIMPSSCRKKFYATKATKRMKNGKFYANDQFDEYTLEPEESWIPGSDAKGVYIKL